MRFLRSIQIYSLHFTTATFTSTSNPSVKISGSYTIPEGSGSSSGVFVPSNPADLKTLPPGSSVGSVTSPDLPGMTTQGQLNFAPGDTGSKPAALFTPTPVTNVKGKFLLIAMRHPEIKILKISIKLTQPAPT